MVQSFELLKLFLKRADLLLYGDLTVRNYLNDLYDIAHKDESETLLESAASGASTAEFGRDGYVMLPGLVPQDKLERALLVKITDFERLPEGVNRGAQVADFITQDLGDVGKLLRTLFRLLYDCHETSSRGDGLRPTLHLFQLVSDTLEVRRGEGRLIT